MPWYWRKYFILTLTLTAFLLITPLFNHITGTLFIEEIVFMALMLSTLHSVAHNKPLLLIGIALTAITIFGSVITDYPDETLFIAGLASAVILLILVICVIIHDVITSDEIVLDTIFGAVAAYLLIGVCWALIYAVADTAIPESILVNTVVPDQFATVTGKANFGFYNYFSFVTMATLGYGDIVPVHPVTRALAAYQTIFGQMFLAILVARLVAMHLTKGS